MNDFQAQLQENIDMVKARFKERGHPPPYYVYTPVELDLADPELIIEVVDDKHAAVFVSVTPIGGQK